MNSRATKVTFNPVFEEVETRGTIDHAEASNHWGRYPDSLHVGSCRFGNTSAAALTPTVVVAEVPFYPPIGRAASLQGVVLLEVTTEGDKADSIKILRGPKLLADAAISNLRSWRFVGKPPQTFQVTYHYGLREIPL